MTFKSTLDGTTEGGIRIDDILLTGVGEDTGKTVDYTGLTLNEICGKADPDDDWIELYNTTSASIDLSGVYVVKTDEEGKTKTIFTFPSESTIDANGFVVVATLTGELTAGISNTKQVGIELVGADGTSIDKFDRDSNVGTDVSHDTNGSYARIPDGTGIWQVVTTATRGISNGSSSGITDNVISATSAVTIANGTISYNGVGEAYIYSVNGQLVSTISANEKAEIANGFYIVKTAEKAIKVIVK